MKNTCIVIWSKDRACQAECLYRSMLSSFSEMPKVVILYDYSTENFWRGYMKLAQEHCKENNGPLTLIREFPDKPAQFFVDMANSYEYIGFLADDNYFFRPFEVREGFFENTVFSLRLGLNTTVQDIFNDKHQRPLSYYKDYGDVISWRWSEYPANDNYGYPMAFDAHIFSSSSMREILKEAVKNRVYHPPSMETFLFNNRHRISPIMSSFHHSVCVNIPVNNMSGNTQDGKKFSIHEANERFLENYKLNFLVKEDEVVACHQLFPFEWKEE